MVKRKKQDCKRERKKRKLNVMADSRKKKKNSATPKKEKYVRSYPNISEIDGIGDVSYPRLETIITSTEKSFPNSINFLAKSSL